MKYMECLKEKSHTKMGNRNHIIGIEKQKNFPEALISTIKVQNLIAQNQLPSAIDNFKMTINDFNGRTGYKSEP